MKKVKTSCLGKKLRASPMKTTSREKQLLSPPPLGTAQFIGVRRNVYELKL